MAEIRENVIEWITGSDVITLTVTQPRYITRVRKMVEHYSQDNTKRADLLENEDGSVFAHLPLECLKLSPKRSVEYSEAQRAAARDRIAAARDKKANAQRVSIDFKDGDDNG